MEKERQKRETDRPAGGVDKLKLGAKTFITVYFSNSPDSMRLSSLGFPGTKRPGLVFNIDFHAFLS